MKRAITMILAASLCLLAGCSSAPLSDRYVGSGETVTAAPDSSTNITNEDNETTDAAADGNAAEAEDGSASNASASPEASTTIEKTVDTKEAEVKKDDKPTSKPAESSSKPTSSSGSAKAAQKNNESTNKAAVGSILDKTKTSDKSDAPKPAAAELGKPIEQIRDLVKQLKTETEKENTEKIKELASQIMTVWSSMQASVQASYPDMNSFIQKKIDALSEQIAAESIDQKAMLQLDYELYQAIRQLADSAGV